MLKGCQLRSKTVSPELVPTPFPRPFHRNSFRNRFTRDNADYVPKSIAVGLMPPQFPSFAAKMNAAKFRCLESFSDKHLHHWHDIHDSVLDSVPLVQVVYLFCVKAKVPKGRCLQIQQFFVEKTHLQQLFASKTFCEFHF